MGSPAPADGYAYPEPAGYGAQATSMYYANANVRRPNSTEPNQYDAPQHQQQPAITSSDSFGGWGAPAGGAGTGASGWGAPASGGGAAAGGSGSGVGEDPYGTGQQGSGNGERDYLDI